MTKVFISYSHDSQPHRDFVRGISDRLRQNGLHCQIDQYINGFPEDGWQKWMQNQIKAADFVLLVCTETYLRRYEGDEIDGGKGVTFEGVVISQSLYDNYYRNTKFVPILPEDGDFEHVPLPLKQYSTYTLPTKYDDLYRYLTDQPEHVAPEVGSKRVMPPATSIEKSLIPSVPPERRLKSETSETKESALQQTTVEIEGFPTLKKGERGGFKSLTAPPPNKIQITKLPHTNSHLFGRETELTMLDNAWAEGVNILILKAMGGTGKTSLLKHWLDQLVAGHFRGAQTVFTWSFYSQGSAESKQVSTDDFFAAALRFFGYTEQELPAPHDRGVKLAHLVAAQRALLILDGLEPLQHPVGTLRGELKDQGLKALLQQLAVSNEGLCLISSRQTVEELKGKAESLVLAHDLEHLQTKDGVKLLQYIGVNGPVTELTEAVSEVAGHALALNLLGNYVKTVLQGDIRQRDKIPGLMAERHDGQHAQKMLAAYETHLHGSTALSVLYLMGLFDRPVSPGAIQCSQQAAIPGLTDALGSEADWRYAIEDLREQKLLNAINPDYPENLDCHPLIREYFAQQLQNQYPEAWQQAHACLYTYYKDLPEKELPDTLEEMQPLFRAVAHGCAAGLHQLAFDEIYSPRINRGSEYYLVKKIGGFSDALATVAYFFKKHWHTPAKALTKHSQALVLNWAGYRLLSLGRLIEAVEPMQSSVNVRVEQKEWGRAAVNSRNLSQIQLHLGNLTAALESASQSVDYADKSGELFHRRSSRTHHAEALHQSGQLAFAHEVFKAAEALQKKYEPGYMRLYSMSGFCYFDLLSAQKTENFRKLLNRGEYILEKAKDSRNLLHIALGKLALGQTHLQLALITSSRSLSDAEKWLEQAVLVLRTAGVQHHLPRGLLARAALFRHSHDFNRARQDLQEVFDMASLSGMKLHMVDYHLEMGRLLLAEENTTELQHHITEASRLITETGYHRRDQELQDLTDQVATCETSPSGE